MINVMKDTQELFCETEEDVETIIEIAKKDGREIVGQEVKKMVKKFKDQLGDKVEIEYYRVRITYQTATVNDIMEKYYGM